MSSGTEVDKDHTQRDEGNLKHLKNNQSRLA